MDKPTKEGLYRVEHEGEYRLVFVAEKQDALWGYILDFGVWNWVGRIPGQWFEFDGKTYGEQTDNKNWEKTNQEFEIWWEKTEALMKTPEGYPLKCLRVLAYNAWLAGRKI